MSHGAQSPNLPSINLSNSNTVRERLLTPCVNGIPQAVRKVPPSGRSITGYCISREGVLLQTESHLEYHAVMLFEFEPAIRSLTTQPKLQGLVRVPDFRAETTTGHPCIIDVKPEAKLVKDWANLTPILSDTNNYCNTNALTYRIFTDHSRNELRNRIDVFNEIPYRALTSHPNLELEIDALSIAKSETSLSVRALAKKLDLGIDYAKKRDIICKLIYDRSFTVLDTPTSWIDDATITITKEEAELPGYLMTYERLVKRIGTHPLRFMNEQETVNYYEGKKEIELAGHKYTVIDATRPESLLIRSVESGEEYRVSFDTYDTPDAKISAYALQEQDPEAYFQYIRRVEIIASLAHFRKIPSESRAKAIRLLGVGERQLERLMADYRKHQASGLLPSKNRGGKGKHRLHLRYKALTEEERKHVVEKVEKIISDTIEEHYLTAQKPTVASVYPKLLNAIDEANKTLPPEQRLAAPAPKTLYNRINERDAFTKVQKREGLREAENRFGVFGNKFDERKFPLQTVMIDHGKMDIILVDNETREPVGRAFLTVMIDTYSSCIPALYIALKQPSANEVGLTILKCALNKDGDVVKYGIREWPIHGIPSVLHFDNAKEFRSNLILAGCAAWQIRVLHRPVMNPKFAGFVERLIKTFQEEIHTLAGTTKSSPQERGIYDSEKEACLTIDELENLLVHFIDKYHHTPREELDGMTPLEKFRHGLAQHGMPRQLEPREEQDFRISFLPAAMRTIQKGGIELEGLTFYSPKLSFSNFPRKDNQGNSTYYIIRYDPFDMRNILILDPKTEKYVLVPSNEMFRDPVLLRYWHIARRKLRQMGKRKLTPTMIFERYKKIMIENAAMLTKTARKEAEIARRQSDIASRFSVASAQRAEQTGNEAEFEPPPIDPSRIRVHFKEPKEHT